MIDDWTTLGVEALGVECCFQCVWKMGKRDIFSPAQQKKACHHVGMQLTSSAFVRSHTNGSPIHFNRKMTRSETHTNEYARIQFRCSYGINGQFMTVDRSRKP